jgi:transcriptional antiterminator RfaH
MAVACPNAESSALRWYVLKVKPHKESYVQMQLRSIAGIEAYCPLMKTARRYRVKWQREIEPVFPGYVFVRMNYERDLSRLRRLHGHVGLIEFSGVPAWVTDALIEDFRRRENARGYLIYRPALRERDTVRIVSGPFRGKTGVFLRYARSAERVCLLLELMRSRWTVELPRAAVEAVAV